MGCWNTGLNSYQKWNVGNTLRTLLLKDKSIKDQIGNNIFPCVAPEKTDGDFIVYKRLKYSKSASKMGVYEDECQILFVVVSDNYDDSIKLAEKIDNVLTGFAQIENIRLKITLVDSSESFEDNKYIQEIIFKVD